MAARRRLEIAETQFLTGLEYDKSNEKTSKKDRKAGTAVSS